MEDQTISKEDNNLNSEYLKLSKNSRGYNFEIKIHIDSDEALDHKERIPLDDKAIKRLEELNNKLLEKFKKINPENKI